MKKGLRDITGHKKGRDEPGNGASGEQAKIFGTRMNAGARGFGMERIRVRSFPASAWASAKRCIVFARLEGESILNLSPDRVTSFCRETGSADRRAPEGRKDNSPGRKPGVEPDMDAEP